VIVRVPDYGGVNAVSYLNPIDKTLGAWNTTISILTALGYEIGRNLRSAPYDWRKSPTQFLTDDFPRMKNLIEQMYRDNGNQKIACVSLSMGGPYFLSFLNNAVSQAWKDKHIHSWSTWDGAFGGSLASTLALTSPKSLYASLLGPYAVPFMNLLRSFPSFIWMMPITEYVGTKVMMSTSQANYTSKDWIRLLNDVGASESAQALEVMMAQNLTKFQPPGVTTYCVYGIKVPTPVSASFNGSSFDTAPLVQNGDGDGTVELTGLEICERWKDKQSQPMHTFTVPGMIHGGSVQNKEVLAYFIKILFE